MIEVERGYKPGGPQSDWPWLKPIDPFRNYPIPHCKPIRGWV